MTFPIDGKPVPEASGPWPFGKAFELARAPHLVPAELGWHHGGLARFRLLRHPFLAVTDPAIARHILQHDSYRRSYHYTTYQAVLGLGLFSTDGEHWARRRRMVLPAFRRERMPRFAPVMRDCVLAMLERWDEECRQGRPVNAALETQRVTLAVIGRALLSATVDTRAADRFAQAVQEAMILVRRRNTSALRLPLWIPTRTNRKLRATRVILDTYVGAQIDARLGGDRNSGDILDDLRTARDGEGVPLSREALLEETKTLFVAGYETTAVSLAWALYLLAAHPEVAAQWHREVDDVLANNDSSDTLSPEALPYVTAIVNESMRLYPAAYNVARVCTKDDIVEGYCIRKGETVLISIYGIHRSPELWEAPDTFRPERFLDGSARHDAFLPFASGKHLCIGASFAMAEMVTALALIGRRFHLRLEDDTPPGMVARVTLAPARDIRLRLERRA